jgi:hypothetical protein
MSTARIAIEFYQEKTADHGRQTAEDTVSFVQEIRSESPESHEKPSISCHCERSEAISWPIWGLLRRLRRLAMTKMGRVEEFKFPEGKIHYPAEGRWTVNGGGTGLPGW